MKKILLLSILVLSLSEAKKEIFVDLTNQTAHAVEEGEVLYTGRISSGMKGRETPTGKFKITEKKEHHVSNLWPKPYGGAVMPLMMRLNGSPIALHGGHIPEYPASHGCIRLETKFAEDVFSWSDLGTQVTVYGGYTGHVKPEAERAPIASKIKRQNVARVTPRIKQKQHVNARNSNRAQRMREDEEMERSFEVMGYYDQDVPKLVETW